MTSHEIINTIMIKEGIYVVDKISDDANDFSAILYGNNIMMLVGLAIAGTIQGVVVALLIVSISSNKVEGMAVGKLSSLFTIG